MTTSRIEIRKALMIGIYQYLLIGADIFSYLEYRKIDPADEFIISILDCLFREKDAFITDLNAKLTDWTFDRLGRIEQAIFLLAYAEMAAGISEKALVINEAVELAKIYCDEESYRLINAALDKL